MASPFTRLPVAVISDVDPASVHRFVENIVGEDLHAKRVFSLARGVIVVMHTASLASHRATAPARIEVDPLHDRVATTAVRARP